MAKTFKCKYCIYFRERQTTGHGESSCACLMLETFKKFVECYLSDTEYCSYKDIKDSYNLDEEEECILFKHNVLEINSYEN